MNSKGQLPIIVAVILSGIIIFSALTSYKVSIFPKTIEDTDWMHLIINVDKDFKRILQASLANFTRSYFKTGDREDSEGNARIHIETWKFAFSLAYSPLSLKISISPSGSIISKASIYTLQFKYGSSTTLYTVYVSSFTIQRGSIFNCSWDKPYSISASHASISLDIIGSKVYGWNNSYTSLLSLNVTKIIVDGNLNEMSITLILNSETGPVNNLSINNVNITINGIQRDVGSLNYHGVGIYNATIKNVPPPPYTIFITLTDSRGIIVRSKVTV
ncbi:MAG: hypothetical protein NDF57_05020 [archaeon GBS-70-058]|nr:hypothetical protein [Candidatus Culexarchaeum nevadense]